MRYEAFRFSDLTVISRTAIETLLERGFVPSRTVLLAFGIDEESSGFRVCYVLLSCCSCAEVSAGRG